MLALFKAEFRKLFTVRSTYIMTIFALIFMGLYSFYFEGYKGNTGSAASQLSPTALQEIVTNGAGMGVLFASIIAILFMAHEYRYNTIMYTLTINVRRTKVLLAKLLTISIFGAIYGLLFILLAIGSYLLGISLRDASLPPQQFEVWAELGKVAFYYAGYSILGIILAIVTRNVVGAIATLLIVSTTLEPLLGVLLKDNAKYLPITVLDSTVGAAISQNVLSPGKAILFSTLYLSIGAFVAWLLFMRRDAS